MWGKEAGWPHSVMLTADLKAFSDRVIAKVEVKEVEVTIKKEEDDIILGVMVKKVATKRNRTKKEPEEERLAIEVKKETARRSKRQRA
jgi:N-glycosylase/DNA lyase